MNEKRCREIVRERSSGRCEICGRQQGVQMHHRRNRSQGGQWTPANILNLCVDDHHLVTVNPRSSGDAGYTVWSYENPAEKPVALWHNGARHRVLLDDEGGVTRYITPPIAEFGKSTTHNPEPA